MKVLLLFPPCWHPLMPHLALPSLTAYLRREGVEVIQRDLNLELYDEVLSRHHLTAVLQQLQRAERVQGKSRVRSTAEAQARSWALSVGRDLVSRIEQAKDIIRSSRFYEAAAGLQALLAVTDGLRLASTPYYPAELHLTGYDSPYPVDAAAAILTATRSRDYNLFYDHFARLVIPQIARDRPDLIGISVTSDRQVIAAFTLAYLLKEAGVQAHITLGGKMMTCWRDLWPGKLHLFPFVDSIILYAGEVPLHRLSSALAGDGALRDVPNLIYREGNRVAVNEIAPPVPVDALPLPDFQGLPLRRYLVPATVLPISGSRGCYWHRCAFCNVGYGESAFYAEKQADRVYAEMRALAERWNVRHFFFSDEAVSPRILKLLSRRLLESDLRVHWTGAARFEPSLDATTLQQIARAGCRMLMYGLESGSPTVLARMHKGIELDTARRILRDGATAGIWNHIFFFFGFPGETRQEAEETIRFFRENAAYIHSACTGTFLLERHSAVAARPQDYDISRITHPYDRDMPFYYDYRVDCGIDAHEAEQIESDFLDTLPQKERAHLYYHDIYRFLYASQFQPGESFPPML